MADYYDPSSPLVRFYDIFSGANAPEGDISFYVTQATNAGGPVLELASGTGRVLIPIAQAGVEITGLDLAPAMLAEARRKIEALPAEAQRNITLVEGDMAAFDLGREFALVVIPFNSFCLSFCLLPTAELQRACLERVYAHLQPGGRLAFSVFDPNIGIIAKHSGVMGSAVKRYKEFADPQTGQRVVVYDSRDYDIAAQTIMQEWVFETLDARGYMISREYTSVRLRYLFRYEMQYLLELCGFSVEALYGDFRRGPFQAGRNQVWIARRE
jgi:SAM-dependent methyltransferase